MDIALCRISSFGDNNYEMLFSGAKRPLLVYNQNEPDLKFIEGDKISIGGFYDAESSEFTDYSVNLKSGDAVFLYSDGLIDQQNLARERFGTKQFNCLLNESINKPMEQIKQSIEDAYTKHKSFEEQRDDITIIGLRLN